MAAPAPIVTRMNSHGWIFCGADSVCYKACRFEQTPLAIIFCSQVCRVVGAGDRVATGLVESLARPGGNVTGESSGGAEVAGKRLPPLTLTR
jgi:hypothetical protein